MGQEEERAKSCCSQTTPKKASVMPPSAPFSSGCGPHNLGLPRVSSPTLYLLGHDCHKVSHSAHTANRCYSEKNKTQTYSKREHFSSSPYHELQAPARRPDSRKNVTPRHKGRGLAGHPRSVRLGFGDNKTRLYTSIRLKTPADLAAWSPHRFSAATLTSCTLK